MQVILKEDSRHGLLIYILDLGTIIANDIVFSVLAEHESTKVISANVLILNFRNYIITVDSRLTVSGYCT